MVMENVLVVPHESPRPHRPRPRTRRRGRH
jgi:hypothetical protein